MQTGSVQIADILVAGDDAVSLATIAAALAELDLTVVTARSGHEALGHLLTEEFALVLLAVDLPAMGGFETARLIRERVGSRQAPIIFIAATRPDDADLFRGYSLGAVDFLWEPIAPQVLRAKAKAFVELRQRALEAERQAGAQRDAERDELELRLQESLREENQRKDEFIAVLAHELRNPLSPLVTGLELIKVYDIEHAGLARVRESMSRQVTHLVGLVDDLLDVSRLSRGKIALRREPIELGTVLRQALRTAGPLLAERRLELSLEPPQEDLWLEGDRERLTQVLTHLLYNAARHTDPGGRIELSGRRDGEEAVMQVVDNGCGIAPKELERIFETFALERAGGGGVGLALVQRLVDLHGGSVHAYSEGPGLGSQLVVRLPLLEAGQRDRRQLEAGEPVQGMPATERRAGSGDRRAVDRSEHQADAGPDNAHRQQQGQRQRRGDH